MKKIINEPGELRRRDGRRDPARAPRTSSRPSGDDRGRSPARTLPQSGTGRHRHRRRLGPPAPVPGLRRHGLCPASPSATSSSSPSSEQIFAATKAVDGGAGVLYLYGNYGGDVLNFDLAGDLAELEDIETSTVVGARRRRQPAARACGRPARRRGNLLRVQGRGRRGRAGRLAWRRSPRVAEDVVEQHRDDGRRPVADDPARRGQADVRPARGRDGDRHRHPRRARHPPRRRSRPPTRSPSGCVDAIVADLGLTGGDARRSPGQRPRRDAARGALRPLPSRPPGCSATRRRDQRSLRRRVRHQPRDGRRLRLACSRSTTQRPSCSRPCRVAVLPGG